MSKFLHLNQIDNRYKVIDSKGFVFGDGGTVDEAIQSARAVTNEPIFTDYECDVIYDKGGVKMNWDTRETAMVLTNEKKYYDVLQKHIGNELYFMVVLYVAIEDYNETRDPGMRIDTSKVNGNEVYIDFCDACGNETEGWK